MTTEQERMRNALWSVYYKRRGLKRSLLPADTRPVRVDDALEMLIDHTDEHGGARRRRAVLEAGAANLHDDDDVQVSGRVRALADHFGIDEQTLDGIGTRDAEPIARQTILKGAGCVAVKTREIGVQYDPGTHDSTLKVVTIVNQPFDRMAPFVDPRRWKVCSDFFEDSDPIDPQTLEPIQVANPAHEFQIHEVFSLPSARFENILNIRLLVRRDSIVAYYSLYDSLSFTLVGFELPGVLERDSGYIKVVPDPMDPRQSIMTTKKTIRFRDLTPDYPVEGGIDHGQWLNYCAPAMLGLWIDDASQARVCCRDAHGG